MRDRLRAHPNRGCNLRSRQREIVTVPENIPDLHHAGPLHRAPASSIRSSDRSGRVGRESARQPACWLPPRDNRRSPDGPRPGRSNAAGLAVKCRRIRGQVRQEFALPLWAHRCHRLVRVHLGPLDLPHLGREASIPFLHHRVVVGVAAPCHRADQAAFAEQGTVGLGRNAMLWVRCLAMGVDPSNAQCTGQVISGRLSNPRSPLQSGIKLQSRLTPKENQLDGGLATFALTEACPVQVGRKPIRTRRPSRSYPKQTKNHLVSRSSRRSPCPPQPSHRIC